VLDWTVAVGYMASRRHASVEGKIADRMTGPGMDLSRSYYGSV
jgi:hypothetical protein